MTKSVTLMIENIPGISFVYIFVTLFLIAVGVVFPKDMQSGTRVQYHTSGW
jgi:hypothetical protein